MKNIETYFEDKQTKWNPPTKYGVYLIIDENKNIFFGQEDVNFINSINNIKKKLNLGTFDKDIQESYNKKLNIYFIELHKILEEPFHFQNELFYFHRKLMKGELLKFYLNSFYRWIDIEYNDYGSFTSYFSKNDYIPSISGACYEYFEFEYKRFNYFISSVGRYMKYNDYDIKTLFPDAVKLSQLDFQ